MLVTKQQRVCFPATECAFKHRQYSGMARRWHRECVEQNVQHIGYASRSRMIHPANYVICTQLRSHCPYLPPSSPPLMCPLRSSTGLKIIIEITVLVKEFKVIGFVFFSQKLATSFAGVETI